MKKLLVLLAIFATVSGCKSQQDSRKDAAIALGNDQLKDPGSARWKCDKWVLKKDDWTPSQLERYKADGPILECEVSAKNSFGGYGDTVLFDFEFFGPKDGSNDVLAAFMVVGEGFDSQWVKIK